MCWSLGVLGVVRLAGVSPVHAPQVWAYFVHDLAGGHVGYGVYFYIQTMAWKLGLLMKLTIGWWDKELLSNMEIAQR